MWEDCVSPTFKVFFKISFRNIVFNLGLNTDCLNQLIICNYLIHQSRPLYLWTEGMKFRKGHQANHVYYIQP